MGKSRSCKLWNWGQGRDLAKWANEQPVLTSHNSEGQRRYRTGSSVTTIEPDIVNAIFLTYPIFTAPLCTKQARIPARRASESTCRKWFTRLRFLKLRVFIRKSKNRDWLECGAFKLVSQLPVFRRICACPSFSTAHCESTSAESGTGTVHNVLGRSITDIRTEPVPFSARTPKKRNFKKR